MVVVDASAAHTLLTGSGLLSATGETIGGNFVQSGGTNIVTCSSTVSYSNGLSLSGTYILSGSGLLCCTGTETISGGTGTFTQSGGTNAAGMLYLADYPRSCGIYNLNGGLLSLTALERGLGDRNLQLHRRNAPGQRRHDQHRHAAQWRGHDRHQWPSHDH